MRGAFVQSLCEAAARDPRIWLLTGDLGFSALEPFAQAFPERFVNAGVAEQNMTGVAAGLAQAGKIVFTYSIANFPTLRCLEQIRNDLCYHDLDVKIVAVGGGLAYGAQGYSHHGLEDLAIMRAMPNMSIVAPADPAETRLAVAALCCKAGPCYLRLGKSGGKVQRRKVEELVPGKMIPVREGEGVLIITTGEMLDLGLETAELFAARDNAPPAVWSSPWLAPFDEVAVARAAERFSLILTLEEGRLAGGLGSAVAEVLAANARGARLLRAGIGDSVIYEIGSREYLLGKSGLRPEELCTLLRREMDRPHGWKPAGRRRD